FLNILVNAAQALPVGAAADHTIRVRTFAQPATDGREGEVTIEVTDSGPGIPKELVSRIFDPFFTTKPVGIGTGLGLWICQGIITSLGGQIEVESTPGSGATFRVRLPARPPGASAAEAPSSERVASNGRRGRVLVIDDEVSIARSLSLALGDEHD